MAIRNQRIEVESGALWEDNPWEIVLNAALDYGEPACKHCVRSDDGVMVCPSVVVAYNEGRNNSTGVCLQCIVERARELGDDYG